MFYKENLNYLINNNYVFANFILNNIGNIAFNESEKIRDVKVFHAGTTKINNILVSSGGRVLSVTSKAKTIEDARSLAYKAIKKIRWNYSTSRFW